MLDAVGLSARIMNENEWSHEQPLKAIRDVISECDGAVVIAFTRTKFKNGLEFKNNELIPIKDINLPTTWNHIEASMAYSFELPLLVVAEHGLKSEGLIEDGYDWRVYWTDMEPAVVKSESFRGFLQSWKSAVDERKKNSSSLAEQIDPSKISIGKLMEIMSVPQLWKLVIALTTVIALIAGGAYKLGAGKWPWQEQKTSKDIAEH